MGCSLQSHYHENIRDRDGRDGQDAAPPFNGGPGGSFAVELSESVDSEGYLHAAVVRWESWQEPVQAIDVPPGRNILLSAVGGAGEDGRKGGDGRSGLRGIDGLSATCETETTVSLATCNVASKRD